MLLGQSKVLYNFLQKQTTMNFFMCLSQEKSGKHQQPESKELTLEDLELKKKDLCRTKKVVYHPCRTVG